MRVKTFKTQRGASDFLTKVKARWPHKLFRVSCEVGIDFRDRWCVEVMFEVDDGAVWVGVGPMTTREEP